MCYNFSEFVFQNCGSNLDFPREIGKCVMLGWFLCKIFERKLWFEKEKETCGLMTCALNNKEIDRSLLLALI